MNDSIAEGLVDARSILGALDHRVRSIIIDGLSRMRNERVRFIQIGGNDGVIADPLFQYHSKAPWYGAIVEPIPDYFKKLKKTNASNGNIGCFNYAVSDSAGELELYYLRPAVADQYPANFVGLASSNRRHLINHGVREVDVELIKVETITPVDLLVLMGNPIRLDLMCIDVEGHEAPIIKSFPFHQTPVEVVLFEAWHMNLSVREDLRRWSSENGLCVFFMWEDGYIVKKGDDFRVELLSKMQEWSAQLQLIGIKR